MLFRGSACTSEIAEDFEHEIQFRRISLIGFPAQSVGSSNAIALDSPYLLVLITRTSQSRQHKSHKSPTAYLFDVDSRRISIITVNTKEYHSDVLCLTLKRTCTSSPSGRKLIPLSKWSRGFIYLVTEGDPLSHSNFMWVWWVKHKQCSWIHIFVRIERFSIHLYGLVDAVGTCCCVSSLSTSCEVFGDFASLEQDKFVGVGLCLLLLLVAVESEELEG
ncbi:hypothetical protein Tco_1032870 [Tanacetum coccineum]|uniref:F-box associated domain-containing protein n=1 Tax=Tanacetum coccineum TaxID=301880 RepID=A0ABQ5GD99_9ASTR